MHFTGPKVKRSRQVSMALTAKSFRVMQSKNQLPGVKSFRPKKVSAYGQRLIEKQKLRYYHNVTDQYLRKMYKLALKQKGNTGENLIRLLNSRLDSIIRDMGLLGSIYHAQQIIGHKKVTINGKRVNICSQLCKEGDIISIIPSFRTNEHLHVYKGLQECVHYLTSSEDGFTVTLLTQKDSDLKADIDVQKVIEFFSR